MRTGAEEPGRARSRLLLTVGVGLLLALLVRAFLVQSFYVSSAGMSPAVAAGDRVLVVKAMGPPAIGDVVVVDVTHHFGLDSRATSRDRGSIGRILGAVASALGVQPESQSVLARVVALGGQRVEVAGGHVTVDGHTVASGLGEQDVAAFTVPVGEVWVLGDNHHQAIDSLTVAAQHTDHGALPESSVVGRAWLTFWPLRHIGLLGAEPAGVGQ